MNKANQYSNETNEYECPECGGKIMIRASDDREHCTEEDCQWEGKKRNGSKGYSFSGVI